MKIISNHHVHRVHQRRDSAGMSDIHVSDEDLSAYVEGRLDTGAQARMEGFLACNPDLAANVMRMWHRQAGADAATGSRRLSTSLRLPLVVSGLLCMAAGWTLAQGLDDDSILRDLWANPEYIDNALMSRRITDVRIGMDSQLESPVLDSAEIERATRIRMPPLPEEWLLLDAQVYPSEEGPSLNVLLEVEPGRNVNLFAVIADTAVSGEPVATSQNGESVAFWESDGVAYVLSGEGSSRDLLADARRLSGLPTL
jgi:anti-sigma factor RsiW